MRKEHLEDLSKDLDELDQLGVRINSTVVKVVKTNQKEDVGRAHAQRLAEARPRSARLRGDRAVPRGSERGSLILLANVLQTILHKVLSTAKVRIFRVL